MKKLITIIVIIVLFGGIHAAERLRLKYAATVTVIGEDGKPIGKRTLKAGTDIAVLEPADTPSASTEKSTIKLSDVPSGISPAQFIAERRTTPTRFVAKGKLDGDTSCLEERLDPRNHWCCWAYLYGLSRNSSESFTLYALRDSAEGKQLFSILKDGEYHYMLVTVHALPNTKWPKHVKLTNVKELPKNDPLIKLLDL